MTSEPLKLQRVQCEALNCQKEGLILSARCKSALFCSAACIKATWPSDDLKSIIRAVGAPQQSSAQLQSQDINSAEETGAEDDSAQHMGRAAALPAGRDRPLDNSIFRGTWMASGAVQSGTGAAIAADDDVSEADSLERIQFEALWGGNPGGAGANKDGKSSSDQHQSPRKRARQGADCVALGAAAATLGLSISQSVAGSSSSCSSSSSSSSAQQEPLMVLSNAAAASSASASASSTAVVGAKASRRARRGSKAAAAGEDPSALDTRKFRVKFTQEMDAALCDAAAEFCDGENREWFKVAEKVGNGVTKKQCRYRWETRFSPEALASFEHDQDPWTEDEAHKLCALVAQFSSETERRFSNNVPKDGLDVEWKRVAAELNRSLLSCRYTWRKIQDRGMDCIVNAPTKPKVTYFSAEEDALIIKRKAEWDAAGKGKGIWTELAAELNREKKTIATHYWDLLCKKYNLADNRERRDANMTPFTPEEDALIIQRKAAWEAEGKMRGFFPALSKEMDRTAKALGRRWKEVLVKQIHGENCVVEPLKKLFTLEEDVAILKAKASWDAAAEPGTRANHWSELGKRLKRRPESLSQRYRMILAPRKDGTRSEDGAAAALAAFGKSSTGNRSRLRVGGAPGYAEGGDGDYGDDDGEEGSESGENESNAPRAKIPFKPEEDIEILRAVAQWDAEGSKRYHWRALGRRLNRLDRSISKRYHSVLAPNEDGIRKAPGIVAANALGLPMNPRGTLQRRKRKVGED